MAPQFSSSDRALDRSGLSPAPSSLARALGAAGLIPFIAGVAAVWLVSPQDRLPTAALLAYAALIASFLGGIHWGLAMREQTADAAQLLWGVSPSLLGWLAVLLPPRWGLLLAPATLIACYAVDRRLYRRLGLGAWLGLRAGLTVVASVCCLLGALAWWLR
ncbi:MAG: DUF3429 domain-containing protein [Polaromonas sp.]|nr:DUF3429 domain-containing protein [Polaromonas sp.]MDP3355288.1 DUF3429 domain-containing protein [Polaromonas sp.]MDP3751631.1 DUF3429 domain-containing protein [Polaromonas sp.]